MDAKIYTKTGDQGQTRLVDGSECSKASLRVETYGAVDELNSSLGLAIAFLPSSPSLESLRLELTATQNQLFNLGSHLACENEQTRKLLPALEEIWIQQMEHSIDQMTAQLPALRNFILPGGSSLASFLHLSRTVCRRAERNVVRLLNEQPHQEELQRALRYLNRLGDYLFVACRWSNQALNVPDQIWKKKT
jgi:cob(I)alamin adenosyltransferase